MKNYIIITVLSFYSVFTFAQSALEGEYFYSGGGQGIISKLSAGKIQFTKPETLLTGGFELEHEPYIKDKIYVAAPYRADFELSILELTDEGYIKHYLLGEGFSIISLEILAGDKKAAKNTAKEFKDMEGTVAALEPVSDFHREHSGELLFFHSEPEFGNEGAVYNANKTFTLGEPVWAVLYLPVPIGMLLDEDEDRVDLSYLLKDGSYGQYLDSWAFSFETEEERTRSHIRFQVLPGFDASAEDLMNYAGAFESILELTEEYEYDVTVEIGDFIEEIFVLDCSQNREQLAQISEVAYQGAIADVELPDAYMHDFELEHQIKQQLDLIAHTQNWQEEFQKVILLSDFHVMEDEYGYIEGKSITVIATATWPDGHCTYQYFYFYYPYEGGGRYGDYLEYGGATNQTDIPCDKIE